MPGTITQDRVRCDEGQGASLSDGAESGRLLAPPADAEAAIKSGRSHGQPLTMMPTSQAPTGGWVFPMYGAAEITSTDGET